jgi:hypothetical protein
VKPLGRAVEKFAINNLPGAKVSRIPRHHLWRLIAYALPQQAKTIIGLSKQWRLNATRSSCAPR